MSRYLFPFNIPFMLESELVKLLSYNEKSHFPAPCPLLSQCPPPRPPLSDFALSVIISESRRSPLRLRPLPTPQHQTVSYIREVCFTTHYSLVTKSLFRKEIIRLRHSLFVYDIVSIATVSIG